ncbi:MAG: iron-containing alcohol dehydrogenase [Anaerolineaceae bacterium]|nr:iron-containing alcohol dehydrogenase [Anaerolineaceae bacterium]
MDHSPDDNLYNRTLATREIAGEVDPRVVVCADDALERLAEVCGRVTGSGGGAERGVALLMDVRTGQVAGAEAVGRLKGAGWRAEEIVVPDPSPGESPICDDLTKAALEEQIGEALLLVAVGSGVVSDLTKWLAGDRGIPYVCFATACSMTGYASANVAPAINGVKTLLRARPPAAVLACPGILRDAPAEMTAAGLGDVLARSVSSMDWRLNHLLFGDQYVEQAVDLPAGVEPLYLERPERLRDGDGRTIEALFAALLLAGLSMTLAGTSSPASGGEHLISHTLDAMSSSDGQAHDLHGRQVGVGTILAAELYERLLAIEAPQRVEPQAAIDADFWGPLAQVVAGHYAEKLPRLQAAREKLSDPPEWRRLAATLRPMHRPPQIIHDCLKRAGAATRAGDIGCDRERLLAAFVHAHQMRSRFTILDLALLAGLMPAAAEEIIDRWAGHT